jgi:hypothetical protein
VLCRNDAIEEGAYSTFFTKFDSARHKEAPVGHYYAGVKTIKVYAT